jgi:malate dehydrogenase (oxaloacetate-decarboxylating)(NADP+)
MVAVISNGTAILGLGNLGALASKPVMEGKAVLFKRFADVDSIDLEVDTEDVDEFINCVRYLGPSFGGINLEDIKAPDCFIIEQRLRELMDIPVFHDDQHGTAIIAAAGLINALHLTGRDSRRRSSSATAPARRHRLHRTDQGDGLQPQTSSSATPRAWSTRAAPRA